MIRPEPRTVLKILHGCTDFQSDIFWFVLSLLSLFGCVLCQTQVLYARREHMDLNHNQASGQSPPVCLSDFFCGKARVSSGLCF